MNHAAAAIENRIRIAVSSSDGRTVDTHFGHTSRFLVFEWRGDAFVPCGDRKATAACAGPDGAVWSGRGVNPMDALVTLINDCRAVICRQIGDCAEHRLSARGIAVFLTDDPVPQALAALVNGGHLNALLSINAQESSSDDPLRSF